MSTPSLDAAISRIGTGRFHHRLVLLCGWANASDAIEMLGVGLNGTPCLFSSVSPLSWNPISAPHVDRITTLLGVCLCRCLADLLYYHHIGGMRLDPHRISQGVCSICSGGNESERVGSPCECLGLLVLNGSKDLYGSFCAGYGDGRTLYRHDAWRMAVGISCRQARPVGTTMAAMPRSTRRSLFRGSLAPSLSLPLITSSLTFPS